MNSTWLTLIVIGITLMLCSALRGLLTFGLHRWVGRVFTLPWSHEDAPLPAPSPSAPNQFVEAWVARLLLPLQLAILIGAGLLIVNVIAPDGPMVWPSLLALTVIAAALAPGNLISEGIAYARIRLLTYYDVDDWVTLVGNQTGRVTAILPLETVLRTATGDWVRIGNSQVLRTPIVQHDSPRWAEGSGWEAALLPRSRRQGPLPRLSKRLWHGATSVQALVRKRGT